MLKKALIGILLVVVGFGVGVSVGYKFLSKPSLRMAAVGESFMALQYAMTQYREAEYPQAVEAVEAYIDFLNRTKPIDGHGWRVGEDPWLDERGRNFDLTLAWIRLALLHERNSNEEAARKAWSKVDSLSAKGNWKDRSHDHLREFVRRIDGTPTSHEIVGEETSEMPESVHSENPG